MICAAMYSLGVFRCSYTCACVLVLGLEQVRCSPVPHLLLVHSSIPAHRHRYKGSMHECWQALGQAFKHLHMPDMCCDLLRLGQQWQRQPAAQPVYELSRQAR